VGWGVNGTLYAMTHGKVYVTCEKTDMNFNKTWIQRFFAGREGQTIYKKYFNVVPLQQHQRFRLIEEN
jgi:large subunit ribosomal protein L27